MHEDGIIIDCMDLSKKNERYIPSHSLNLIGSTAVQEAFTDLDHFSQSEISLACEDSYSEPVHPRRSLPLVR